MRGLRNVVLMLGVARARKASRSTASSRTVACSAISPTLRLDDAAQFQVAAGLRSSRFRTWVLCSRAGARTPRSMKNCTASGGGPMPRPLRTERQAQPYSRRRTLNRIRGKRPNGERLKPGESGTRSGTSGSRSSPKASTISERASLYQAGARRLLFATSRRRTLGLA